MHQSGIVPRLWVRRPSYWSRMFSRMLSGGNAVVGRVRGAITVEYPVDRPSALAAVTRMQPGRPWDTTS